MVRLEVLSGSKAGVAWVSCGFPVSVGRSATTDLQLEESGVWDQHLRLDFDPARGIVLRAQSKAIAAVNGELVQETILRNGDTIDIGSAKLRFGLSETRQKGLRFREGLTWACIAAISISQVALVYLLLR